MIEGLYQGDYWFSRFLIQRALALVYLLAFINVLNQFRPLVGENGLLPVSRILDNRTFKKSPSLFYWHYSDKFLFVVAWTGIILSLLAFFGITEMGNYWVSMTAWFILWALYLSIVNVGQIFWGYGWESMLLEAGFFAIFLGPLYMAAPVLVIWMFRWMLFRVEFGAGLIKMRGDLCWRDLTCMNYHHETQPLPNPLSRFFHLLPDTLHKTETLFNHFVQLIAVWGLFFPQPVASVAAGLIIISQAYLIISGNYSWLNWLTLSLGFSGISDGVITTITGLVPPGTSFISPPLQGVLVILTLIVIWLSIKPLKNMISPRQMMNFSFNPLHLVNTYGAFGTVTKARKEIILEGTRADPGEAETDWKAFEFKGKPGNPSNRPRQVSPYHLRLDWQMWFAALRPYTRPTWFNRLVLKLLQNNRQVADLLKRHPFGDDAPRQIRARIYRYRYADYGERKSTGKWWIRTFEGEYMPAVSLEDFGRGTEG